MLYFSFFTEIPEKVGENYCNIEPLEQLPPIPSTVLKGYVTSTFKASHVKTGMNYFLRRIHSTYRVYHSFLVFIIIIFFKLTIEHQI